MSQGILGVWDQGLGFRKHQKSREIAELKEGYWGKQVEKNRGRARQKKDPQQVEKNRGRARQKKDPQQVEKNRGRARQKKDPQQVEKTEEERGRKKIHNK
jgi:hypothetical protein